MSVVITPPFYIIPFSGFINLLYSNAADNGNNIARDLNGNLFAVGNTSGPLGSTAATLIKYASDGTILWQRTLDGTGTEFGYDVTTDDAGNAYIVGSTTSYSGNTDAYIAKYDSNGVFAWSRVFSASPSNDYGNSVAVNPAGTVIYLIGESSSTLDIFIVRMNFDGSVVYQRTISGASTTDYGYGGTVDSSGNLYLTGFASIGSTNAVFTAKLASGGSLTWQRTLNATYYQRGYGVATDSSDNVYVVGYTNAFSSGSTNALLVVKYNSSGVLQWQRRLGGDTATNGRGIAVDSSGNVYVTGFYLGTGNDIFLVKYDTDGTLIWKNSLTASAADSGLGVAVDDAGNYVYLVGSTSSGGVGSSTAILLAKFKADGSQLGTYGNYTYEECPLVDYGSPALTDSAGSLTASVASLTTSTSTGLTSGTGTLSLFNVA